MYSLSFCGVLVKSFMFLFFASQAMSSRSLLPAYFGHVSVAPVWPSPSLYEDTRLFTTAFLSAVDIPSEIKSILFL